MNHAQMNIEAGSGGVIEKNLTGNINLNYNAPIYQHNHNLSIAAQQQQFSNGMIIDQNPAHIPFSKCYKLSKTQRRTKRNQQSIPLVSKANRTIIGRGDNRMNTTTVIEPYQQSNLGNFHKHNQTVYVDPSYQQKNGKKMLIATHNQNQNFSTISRNEIGNGTKVKSQLMNYNKEKRSESVTTNRPEQTNQIYTTQQPIRAPNIQIPQSGKKRQQQNSNNNRIRIQTHNRPQSNTRQREEEVNSQNYIGNSNVSDNASLLGDYGGTKPVQNPSSSQTRKAAAVKNLPQGSRFFNPTQQNRSNIGLESGVSSKVSQQSQIMTNNKSQLGNSKQNIDQNSMESTQANALQNFRQINQPNINKGKFQSKKQNYDEQFQDQALYNNKGQIEMNIIKDFDLNQDSADFSDSQDQMQSHSDSYVENNQEFEDIEVPDIKLSNNSSQRLTDSNQQPLLYNMRIEESSSSTNPIFIQDDAQSYHKQAEKLTTQNPLVAQFEIFESSSEEELSQCAYESAAESFQKREKGERENSQEKEQKQKDRQRRVDRKKQEKLKKKKDQEKQNKKDQRLINQKKMAATTSMLEQLVDLEDIQDDLLNFKDSERESLISYLAESRHRLVDTPTRLVNESNEFLGMKNPHQKLIMITDQAAQTGTQANKQVDGLKQSKELNKDKTQLSTDRMKELKRKDQLMDIIMKQQNGIDLNNLQQNIHKQIQDSSNNQQTKSAPLKNRMLKQNQQNTRAFSKNNANF
eukprot:403364346